MSCAAKGERPHKWDEETIMRALEMKCRLSNPFASMTGSEASSSSPALAHCRDG